MSNPVLRQLFMNGPTHDSNIASKGERDDLLAEGLIDRTHGFNFLTVAGVELAIETGKRLLNHSDLWYIKSYAG